MSLVRAHALWHKTAPIIWPDHLWVMLKKRPPLPLFFPPPHSPWRPPTTTTTIKSLHRGSALADGQHESVCWTNYPRPRRACCVFSWADSVPFARAVRSSRGANSSGPTLPSWQWGRLGLCSAAPHGSWFYWAQHPRVRTFYFPTSLCCCCCCCCYHVRNSCVCFLADSIFVRVRLSGFISPLDPLT